MSEMSVLLNSIVSSDNYATLVDMALRKRGSVGRNVHWTEDELRAGFEKYFELHQHYPTACEVNDFEYLPTARSIQRTFGGLVQVRTKLGLAGDADLRTGIHSTKRAFTINARAHKVETVVYTYLVELFGKPFVHREFFFTDDHRTRADFFVYDTAGGFCVDVFYPSSIQNLMGCVNIKERKYRDTVTRQYPVYFLYMNDDISKERVASFLQHKKNAMPDGVMLVDWEAFQKFCNGRIALKVIRE